jgi:mannonate dehydratase
MIAPGQGSRVEGGYAGPAFLVHEMMPGTAAIKGGYLYGNDRPGLGVDINEKMAAKYPLKPYPYPLDWLKVYSIDGAVGKP